ncbi:MAG: DMT family transporter [Thermodesulfobacteriota bacterium]
MAWIPFALLTAFSLATADALSKRRLRDTNEYVIAWVREGYALPFLVLVLLFIPIPDLDRTFWFTVLILLPLEITAILLYVKAIRVSPLSLTIPFMALSPAFIILIAFLFLGELPDLSGLVGVFLIVVGAYVLNAKMSREGLFEPIRAIGRERGSVLMIIVAFIYSITSTLGKVAVQHSSPIFFGFFYPFILTIILSCIIGYRGLFRKVVSRPMYFLVIGFFTAVMVISHFVALSLTDVVYMISVKRTSLIFSVIYGWLIFYEENIKERLIGSVIMVAGVVLIVL